MALVACGVASAHAQLLWDNGGPIELIENSGTTLGSNMSNATPFRLADNFTVPAGETWEINQVRLYGYQTGSGTTPTINNAVVAVYRNGTPATGTLVWGDFTTNRLASATFTGLYRSSPAAVNTQRPIMELNVDTSAMPKLGPGTYWVAWATTGTVASGPWCPPMAARKGTADALQQSSGTWANLVDSGSTLQRDLPFKLDGTRTTHGAVYAAQLGAPRIWGYYRTNGGVFVNWTRVFNSGIEAGWNIVGFGDINNDGRSDAILRNTSTGRLATWTLVENQIQVWNHLANLPLGFGFVGAGDVNGDGFDDLFTQNLSTRQIGVHLVTAGFAVGAFQPLSLTPDAGTMPVGVGDLSGDGLPDVLFDNGKGRLGYWTVTGNTTVSAWTIMGFTSPNWSVVGLVDMDQDDDVDVVVKVPTKNEVGYFARTSATTLGGYMKTGNVNLATSEVLGVALP